MQHQPPDFDAIIVGGGMAGLAAAWSLRHRRILLLEASDRVGGRVRSEQRGPYWLNFGAHLFGDENSAVGRLVAETGLETRIIPGNRMGMALGGKVVASGRAETYPLRLPLSPLARLSFIKMGVMLRTGTKRFMKATAPREGDSEADRRLRLLSFENDRTLRDYVGRLHPEVEPILESMTERTSASPDTMAAGHGFASLTHVWTAHAVARNLVGGSALLPQALADTLANAVLREAPVSRVEQHQDHATVTYRWNGDECRATTRFVVVATQAPDARNIVSGLPADTAQALADIHYGHFLSMAVLTKEKGPMPWDGSYAIATPGLSFGVFFNMANVLRHSGARQDGGSLMLFSGATGAARLMEKSDAEIERLFLRDLEILFPQAKGIVSEAIVQRWPRGAPYAYPGRAKQQPALTKPLGRIFLAGDYLEFPAMDSAVSAGREAAGKIEHHLATG